MLNKFSYTVVLRFGSESGFGSGERKSKSGYATLKPQYWTVTLSREKQTN
jgi:hypothetical protein